MRSACGHRVIALMTRPREAQRLRDQLLGAVALGVAQQLLGLHRRVAELEQARRGRARAARRARRGARRSAPRARDRAVHAADLLAQLDDDPLGGALADARARPGSARRRRAAIAAEQLARRAAGEHRQRDLRPDRLDRQQHQEQVALLLGVKAVQRAARRRARSGGCAASPRSPTGGTWRSVSAETAAR